MSKAQRKKNHARSNNNSNNNKSQQQPSKSVPSLFSNRIIMAAMVASLVAVVIAAMQSKIASVTPPPPKEEDRLDGDVVVNGEDDDIGVVESIVGGSSRTVPLPLLDSLFPFQTLDVAWEEHPLLSTIYHPEVVECKAGEGQCTAASKEKMQRKGNAIPVIHAMDAYQERLDFVQQLIAPTDVDKILYPDNHQPLVHGSDYKLVKKIWRDGEEWTGSLPDAMIPTKEQRANTMMEGGFSLIIDQLQKRWAPATKVARSLQQETLSQLVSCNLYLTPPPNTANNAKHNEVEAGFESHWDWMDVLVLQVSGEKLWSVAKQPKIEMSARDQKHKPTLEDMEEYLGRRYDEFLLRPGDALYIPRGFMHNASTTVLGGAEVRGNNQASGPRFSGTPSLHLTFGIEHGCQTTVEALMHHAIEVYAASVTGAGTAIAIHSHFCPAAAAGRNILWKDVVHFVVAEVARRQDVCRNHHPTGNNNNNKPNSCLLRRSVPIHEGFKQLALSRHRRQRQTTDDMSSSIQELDDVLRSTLVEAFSIVLHLMNPEEAAQFVWRLENGKGESIRYFCHPYMGPQSTIPCPEALAQVDISTLRSYLVNVKEFSSKHFGPIQKQMEDHVSNLGHTTRQKEDEQLRVLGQSLA